MQYDDVKVKDLPYKRCTLEQVTEAFNAFMDAVKNATCADDVIKARNEILLPAFDTFSTMESLSNSRFTLNTRDEFYNAEVEYYNEITPIVSGYSTKYSDYMLNSPFRKELQQKLGDVLYRTFEVSKKAYDDVIEKEVQQENAISMEYQKLMSQMACKWNGEDKPLSFVRGFLEDEDRSVREKAAFSIGEALKANSEALDDIYDRLVKVRDKMAKKMGYKNFTELGYYRMGRIDYDRDMVEKFRANVKKSIVPVVAKLKADVAKKLGIDKVMFYDDTVYSKGEVPKRTMSVDDFFKAASSMYNEMDGDLGKFFDTMVRREAFDVEARDGKWGGGYCTNFRTFKQIFILANFNGASGDIDVITHEFGHAIAMNYALERENDELGIGGNETAECHSMSMEFLAWPWMDKFFGGLADAYRRKHLCDSLTFIPYGCMVDEFQHIVYDNPEMTPAERKAAWRDLEKQYRPYMCFDGIPYLEEGTRWQYQMHIYESPFYYIDYCLAQTVALGFLALSKENYSLALEKYKQLCKAGGSKFFSQLIKDTTVAYPFGDGTLDKLADKVGDILSSLK